MLSIGVILLLIALNAYFALTEAAFMSSRKSLIVNYMEKKKKSATFILQMMDQPEKFLSSIQVCITLIGIVSGVFGGIELAGDLTLLFKKASFFPDFAPEISIVLVVFAITYLSIVLGELVPKSIAMNNPERIALFSAPVIKLIMILFLPVVNALTFSTKVILFLTGFHNKSGRKDPVREIVSMIRMATVNNKLDKEQEKIILNTINMTKVKLRDIMVDKSEIKYLNSSLSISEAFIKTHTYHHTRYLVVENDNLNKTIGYVNFKDIINALNINHLEPGLLGIVRPVKRFNYNESIVDILPKLIKNNQHIAVITNKNNTVVGLVTMEDVIESIFGDIYDEYDLLPEYFYKIAENYYVIGGGYLLDKLNKQLDIGFDESNITISDWLLKKGSNGIKTGKCFEYKNSVFTVKKMKLRQIYEVILEMKE